MTSTSQSRSERIEPFESTPAAGRSLMDRVAFAASWLAVVLLALLAVGTLTVSVPGTPIRMLAGTAIHAGLALFAAPPVRRYLRENYGITFGRWTVAAILVVGVIVNEGLITPEVL
ncbi:hypothetical protein [Halobellus marinus]|uniref:hypothetical protein n=1 Tax=Halobellus TaxID=1073986 RepID=UPI0028A99A46|nr:hypothetical protein [Halobellus sp. DFY28]